MVRVALLIAFPEFVTYFLDPAVVHDLDKVRIEVAGPGSGLDSPPGMDLAAPPKF